VNRRQFLLLLALAPTVRAQPDFLGLSRQLTGVTALDPRRAAALYAELRSPALDRLLAEGFREESWALDVAERVVNAWYSGPDSLAWSCARGAGPPGVCSHARWWEEPGSLAGASSEPPFRPPGGGNTCTT